jgi:predicted ATPase
LSSAIRGVCGATLEASASRLDEVAAALDDYQQAGYQLGTTGQFALVASALILCKEPEAALERIDRGLSIVTRSDERYFEAELYRLKARALLMRGAMDAEVESLLDRALQTARRQQARSFELRAAVDLARVWMNQDKPADAVNLLGPVYARFSEGFNTPDLKNAKALFTELSEVTTSQANNST